ncbi:site-specific DNA-methyltransferase [Pseudomonas aeruginosa]|uniref:DNA-methyltransferase n=2 Tax=Pseudomonas aeruginosa TaxID=287 RepID=UPI00053EA81E|nr:site-specific DNA-methyltransferase [Pseudomonas aeruginosa]EKY1861015.1 site-specific DNA-methyltransferase [Pseudomonas aeruginosa]MBG5552185.1 site-specific DNA-methyltransferase [Pseudomonas aeruginosa]MBH3707096.1 site-specific DNA-methyltransferase [Pseudomonas aeruginosa]MBH4373965.1 site-specific DNA-methyltransferase [Pseudomonas aeruginosa]MBN5526747.1 site-specific DNA-methyltransferase [Pseudomonas aeruginosa]
MPDHLPYTLHLGDCLQVLKTFPDNSFDSVVTDPPYGIRFMGKAWDGADIEARAARRAEMPSHAPDAGPNGGHRSVAAEAGKYDLTPKGMLAFQAFTLEWAAECLRVLRPGGHLLSFASPRTYHHMAVGIEMAGFEIRDQIMWVFGSGFPKSHNLSGEFEGWGTALKPGHEPICMARKPLVGTVAANVLAHGTGALNIDACRIPTGEALRTGSGGIPCRHDEHVPRTRSGGASAERRYIETGGTNFAMKPGPRGGDAAGRWPANLIHDGSEEVVALFPESTSGAMKSGTQRAAQDGPGSVCYGTYGGNTTSRDIEASSGSAARFFYCAKASRKDRNEGCEHMERKPLHRSSGSQNPGSFQSDGTDKTSQNNHPTVKPTDLMAYLVRLVTPPGGKVLDPFTGSGSTGKAAVREGFEFVGIEREPPYLAIAEARIAHELERVTAAAEEAAKGSAQLDIFHDAKGLAR